MIKLIVCQTATLLFGLLAIATYFRLDVFMVNEPNYKLIGEAFGLLSAIFATQWVEYQKRFNKYSVQEH